MGFMSLLVVAGFFLVPFTIAAWLADRDDKKQCTCPHGWNYGVGNKASCPYHGWN